MTSDPIHDLLRDHAAARQRVIDDHMFTIEEEFFEPATLRLQLFTAAGRRPVAILTQTTNEGPSLVNGTEEYVAAVWQRHLSDADEPPICIQRQILPEGTFDFFQLVTFDHATPYTVTGPGWTTLADDEVARLVGAPVDPGRGDGYMPRPPEPEDRLCYDTVWVVRLPCPRPFRQKACMPTGTPWWRRLGRQLAPVRTGRDCCWYHGGNWHTVTRTGQRLLRQALRKGVLVDDIPAQAEAAGMTPWECEALWSLLEPSVAINLGSRRRSYVNGQHRAQTQIDAGVRRTIVIRWEPAV